jgi:hypothetical protein
MHTGSGPPARGARHRGSGGRATAGSTSFGENHERSNARTGARGGEFVSPVARYTPFGTAEYGITNPALIGQIKQGDKFYVDFTPAE